MEETCSVLELAWLNSLSPVVLTKYADVTPNRSSSHFHFSAAQCSIR